MSKVNMKSFQVNCCSCGSDEVNVDFDTDSWDDPYVTIFCNECENKERIFL